MVNVDDTQDRDLDDESLIQQRRMTIPKFDNSLNVS